MEQIEKKGEKPIDHPGKGGKETGYAEKIPKRKDRISPNRDWRPKEGELNYKNFNTFRDSLMRIEGGKVRINVAEASEIARLILKLVRFDTSEITDLAYRYIPEAVTAPGQSDEQEEDEPIMGEPV